MTPIPNALRLCPTIVAMISVIVGGGCAKKENPDRSDAPYNVLLVTLDTTRADRLGCYGYDRNTSPRLDALANEGTRFDLAIAQAASTPVSHASILTGLYPAQHGVRVIYAAEGYRLPDNIPTLATMLGSNGWRTGAFLSSFTVSEFFGFDRGFDEFDNGLPSDTEKVLNENRKGTWGWNVQMNQRRSDQTTDRAIEWIKKSDKPFFSWVHYWDAHDARLVPPKDIVAKFAGADSNRDAQKRDLYDAEIYYVDSQLGRLLDALRAAGQYDNTIIVVVADHGEGLGDHGWWYHRLLYQEQIRVPLLVRVPNEPGGRVVSDLVRTVDIFPTVLEKTKLALPDTVEGLSLTALMNGKQAAPRIAYADALNLFDLNAGLLKHRPTADLLYCAMDKRWKLIYTPKRPNQSELYDLQNDPRELKNLYGAKNDQASRLLEALNSIDAFVDKPFGTGTESATLSRLSDLGYVGGDDPDSDELDNTDTNGPEVDSPDHSENP